MVLWGVVFIVPSSTYRVQLGPGFGFDDVAAIADYLAALGVSHVYLSPVLEPTPGSTHGYDVVDHSRLNTEAGGRTGFDRLVTALRDAGLSAVADVVPNHMAVPTPARLNAALWSVLRDGPGSPFAAWFDVDWSVESRALLMPVLGRRIGEVLADGELTVDSGDGEPVLRYGDHEFPLRPGTENLPLKQLVDRQWYRRNLFDGLDVAPVVNEDEVLLVVDRPTPDAALPFVWLAVAGIDRSTPYRGITVVNKNKVPALAADVAVYVPASKRYVNMQKEESK